MQSAAGLGGRRGRAACGRGAPGTPGLTTAAGRSQAPLLRPCRQAGRHRLAGPPAPPGLSRRWCQMSHSLSLDVMEMAEVAALLERLAAGLEAAPTASPPLSSSACSERTEPCVRTCCCSLQGTGTHSITARPSAPRGPADSPLLPPKGLSDRHPQAAAPTSSSHQLSQSGGSA